MIEPHPSSIGRLPTKGKFYPEGHPFHEKTFAPLYPMRVSDEAILMNPYLARTKQIDQELLRSITGIKDLDVYELLAGDVAGLYFSLFIANYDYKMERKMMCQKCGEYSDCYIEVDNFPIRTCDAEPDEPYTNCFSVPLPGRNNVAVQVRFLTHGDILYLGMSANDSARTTELLRRQIVSVNGNDDPEIIDRVISKLTPSDRAAIRNFLAENEPGVISKYTFYCQNMQCKEHNTFHFAYGAEMFGLTAEHREDALLEPAWLLSYLSGESFQSTWDWPVSYRKWWIKRIEKDIMDRSEKKEDIPDKHPMHNQPDIRELLGKQKIMTPNSRTQRFT